MSSLSDLHIEICEEIEDALCKELNMEKCQRTYEIATLIFNSMIEKFDALWKSNANMNGPSTLHIDHVDSMTIY